MPTSENENITSILPDYLNIIDNQSRNSCSCTPAGNDEEREECIIFSDDCDCAFQATCSGECECSCEPIPQSCQCDENGGILYDFCQGENFIPICQEVCLPNADVNQDGLTNVLDVVQIVNAILNDTWAPGSCEYIIADINQDGSLNVLDLVELVNAILGSSRSNVGSNPREETEILNDFLNSTTGKIDFPSNAPVVSLSDLGEQKNILEIFKRRLITLTRTTRFTPTYNIPTSREECNCECTPTVPITCEDQGLVTCQSIDECADTIEDCPCIDQGLLECPEWTDYDCYTSPGSQYEECIAECPECDCDDVNCEECGFYSSCSSCCDENPDYVYDPENNGWVYWAGGPCLTDDGTCDSPEQWCQDNHCNPAWYADELTEIYNILVEQYEYGETGITNQLAEDLQIILNNLQEEINSCTECNQFENCYPYWYNTYGLVYDHYLTIADFLEEYDQFTIPPEGRNRDYPPNSLWLTDRGNDEYTVNINSSDNISAFELVMESAGDIVSVYGGVAEENGFIFSIDGNLVYGFSDVLDSLNLTSSVIPPQESGELFSFTLSEFHSPPQSITINSIVDELGEVLDFQFVTEDDEVEPPESPFEFNDQFANNFILYIEEFVTVIENMSATIELLNGTITEQEGSIEDLQNLLTSLEDTIETLEGQVTTLEGQVTTLEGLVGDNILDYTYLADYLGLSYTISSDDIQANYNLDNGSITCESYNDPTTESSNCLSNNACDGLVADVDMPTIYIEPGRFTGIAIPPVTDLNINNIMNQSLFQDVDLTVGCQWCDGTQIVTDSFSNAGIPSGFSGATYLQIFEDMGMVPWVGDDSFGGGYYYYIFTPESNPNNPEGCCNAGYFKFSNTPAQDVIIQTGCMDENALNYNPNATIDDGSCEYEQMILYPPYTINCSTDVELGDPQCCARDFQGGNCIIDDVWEVMIWWADAHAEQGAASNFYWRYDIESFNQFCRNNGYNLYVTHEEQGEEYCETAQHQDFDNAHILYHWKSNVQVWEINTSLENLFQTYCGGDDNSTFITSITCSM